MLLRFSGFFTLIFFIIFSVNIFANPAGKTDENREFDVNEMIMHHIKDAHEFHIMDIDGHAVSFPLPIILWTDNGLVTFLSSEFNHNDSGEVIVERKGQEFIKYHEKIFYANNTGGD
jgi:F-type H+-transporting ATPase subunit a